MKQLSNVILVVPALMLAACQAKFEAKEKPPPQQNYGGYGQAPTPGAGAPIVPPPTQQTPVVQAPPPASAPPGNPRAPINSGGGPVPEFRASSPRPEPRIEPRIVHREAPPVVRVQPVPPPPVRVEVAPNTERVCGAATNDCYVVQQQRNCVSQTFVQPAACITNKVDILLVFDTSQSGDKERREVANGIDGFLSQLPRDSDYRIAVMPAHGSKSGFAGKLWAPQGEAKVLSSSPIAGQPTLSKSAIQDHLLNRILTLPVDTRDSDRGELGLFSTTWLLSHPHLKNAKDAGFFRPDAALAVVFIADENDICARYPPGVTPKKDPQNMEAVAKARDCHGISVKDIYERLTELKGNMPFTANGIIYTSEAQVRNNDRTDAYSEENEVGHGYLDIIRYTNGVAVPIRGNIIQGMASIGEKLNLKLYTRMEFALDQNINYRNDELEFYVDGAKQAPELHYYHRESKRLHAHRAGKSGSTVRIDYCRAN